MKNTGIWLLSALIPLTVQSADVPYGMSEPTRPALQAEAVTAEVYSAEATSATMNWSDLKVRDSKGTETGFGEWLKTAADASLTLRLNQSATLTANEPLTLANLTVSGTGTLTLSGKCVTAQKLSLEANTVLSASTDTLSVPAMNIAKGAMVTMEQKKTGSLPSLTGDGLYEKTGTGQLEIYEKSSAGNVRVRIRKGNLYFLKKENGDFHNAYDIELLDGTQAVFGIKPQGLRRVRLIAKNNRFLLHGGSIMQMDNGNGGALNATITLTKASQKDVRFKGSIGGSSLRVTGSVSVAPGEKETQHLTLLSDSSNPWTFNAIVRDNVLLKFSGKYWRNDFGPTSSGNTHTGGTVIDTTVTVRRTDWFGNGNVTVNAGKTMTVNKGATLTVKKSTSLRLAGKVEGATAFEDGACLDIADSQTITPLASGNTSFLGKWVLRVSKTQMDSGCLTVSGPDATLPTSFEIYVDGTADPTATLVKTDKGLQLGRYTAPSAPEGSPAYSDSVQAQLRELANSVGASSVRLEADRTQGTARNEEIGSAMDLFRGIATAEKAQDATEATVSIAYDFGISSMRPTGDGKSLAVAVTVQSRTTGTAAYGDRTRVEMMNGDTAIIGAEPLTESERKQYFGENAPTDGVRYFRIPMPGPRPLRIYARAVHSTAK